MRPLVLNEQLKHELSPFGIITLSIGVATFVAGETPQAFIKKVDDALYAAKQRGRNQVCLAHISDTPQIHD